MDNTVALRGPSSGDHGAVRAREDGPRLTPAERLHFDHFHIPDACLGGWTHHHRGRFPNLLRLLVLRKTRKGTAEDIAEGDVFLLRHGSHGQEEAEMEGSHGLMTSSGEG